MPLQFTSYAPGSCQLIGEADLYGPGVRVSYYLFFFATLLAILSRIRSGHKVAPLGDCAKAINILTFSVLVVLVRNTANGSFAALEWFLTYPVILVTFVSTCFALRVRENAGILICFGFILAMLTCIQPWLYWSRLYQGSREGCTVSYWFFGVRNFYAPTWTTFFRVVSIIFCVAGAAIFVLSVVLAFMHLGWRVLFHLDDMAKAAQEEDGDSIVRAAGKQTSKLKEALKILGVAVLLFVGILTMVMTEQTIQVNSIDLSETPFDSTSQLIPFLTGLFSFLSTFWSCFSLSRGIARLVKRFGGYESLPSSKNPSVATFPMLKNPSPVPQGYGGYDA